ncbi:MAG TPA: hypothetical protein VJ326_00760 [Thermoplasmata archaeon]|nr:hypothetical protein [Thermoplasmata archaeon]
MEPPSSPWGAALLSFMFPGLGQVYAHDFVKGCLLLTVSIGLGVFVFPIGVLAFIALYLREPFPIAWFVAGVPSEFAPPALVISVLFLAPVSWFLWFASVVQAYDAATQHNERFASLVCKVCGRRYTSGITECPNCGAPAVP